VHGACTWPFLNVLNDSSLFPTTAQTRSISSAEILISDLFLPDVDFPQYFVIAIPKLPVELFNTMVATCKNHRCEALFRMVTELKSEGMLLRCFLENGCVDYTRLRTRDDFEGLEDREVFTIRPRSAADSDRASCST
jgi:hypothetical protein